jgi:hypothetical protein
MSRKIWAKNVVYTYYICERNTRTISHDVQNKKKKQLKSTCAKQLTRKCAAERQEKKNENLSVKVAKHNSKEENDNSQRKS